jgi:hypothetical protein
MIVAANNKAMRRAPGFSATRSACGAGRPRGTAKCMIKAGTMKFTTDGTNSRKKSANATSPFCHTIRVVMSPNGLNAPPALAATTMLTQDSATKPGISRPSAMTTAHITSAVVRLSAKGEITKASPPVAQNNAR